MRDPGIQIYIHSCRNPDHDNNNYKNMKIIMIFLRILETTINSNHKKYYTELIK